MFKKLLSSLLLTAFVAAGVQAADQGDIAQELIAEWVTLPAAQGGDVEVKGCENCPTRKILVTPQSSFEIDTNPVRYSELRAALADQPQALVLLQLTPDRKKVARLVLFSATR